MAQENSTSTAQDATFSTALREAIRERGVTLAWLNARLRDGGNPVSMATLSYWRSGARRPEGAQSLAAVGEIEQLLDLPVGALSGAIGRSLRVGPFGSPTFPLPAADLEAAVTEVFEALGEPQADRVRDVTTQVVTEVGPAGTVRSRSIRTLIQSMSGLVTHVPYVEMTPGQATPPPPFTALGGGRIDRVHSHPSGEVHGFAFELDQPIDTAETTMIEWRIDYSDEFPATRETGHGFSRQCRELLMWTRFDPAALPTWVDEVVETPEASTRIPVVIDRGSSVHQVRRRFGPGMLSLEWGDGPRD
ncbi:hypothetical protein ACWGJP_05425 [Microbacterium sp. NPDC055903]